MLDRNNAPAPAPGGSGSHSGTQFVSEVAAPKPPAPHPNSESEHSVNDSESIQGDPAEDGVKPSAEDQYGPTKREHPLTTNHGHFSVEPKDDFSSSSSQEIVDERDEYDENNANNNEGKERAKGESETQKESGKQTPWPPSDGTGFMRSFFGFIEDPMDAITVVEACIAGTLNFFQGNAPEMAYYEAKSGDVIVIPESNRVVRRWRDNIQWSPSRAFGPFLLYRQVEPIPKDAVIALPLKYSFRRVQSNVAALEPTFSTKTLKTGTRVVENGLTKRTITLFGSDGQKHRVINYYRPNDVIEMCHRDANGIEAADGEEVFQKPSKVATLKEAIVSKELNLNQLLKGQNLHEESTSKSFRIISESPESEGPPDDQDTPRQKRQKQEGSILHMAQEGVGTYHSQTPPAHENPPRQSSQPPKFLIPFQPPNSQANENSLANSNSFYPRPVNYPCPPPPHMMQRPPSMQHYPLNQSPTNESFQPRPAYHQQQQPEESPVVYNLPAGASWSNLMPPPNYVYPTPPVPSYFHRLQHPPYHPAPWSMSIQHLYVPSPDPYGSYPNHLPNQSSLPEYPPPHSYSAPPPHPYPGYTGMIPASMHVQAAGQRHQQHPSYYMGPPQPELPSLPQDPAGDGDGHPIL